MEKRIDELISKAKSSETQETFKEVNLHKKSLNGGKKINPRMLTKYISDVNELIVKN